MAALLRLAPLILIVCMVFFATAHDVKKIKSNPDGSLGVGFKKGHIISGMYAVDVPSGEPADQREVVITGPDVKDSVTMKFDANTMVFSDWDGLFMLGEKVYSDRLGSLYFFHSDEKCTRKLYRTQGSEVVVIDDFKLERSTCSLVREKVIRALDHFLTTPFRYMLSHPTVKLLNTPGFPGGDYVRGVTEGSIQCGQFSIVIPPGDADQERRIKIFGPGVYEEVKMKFDYGTAVFGRWDGYFYVGDMVFSLEPQTLVIQKDDGSCEKKIYEKQGPKVAAIKTIPIRKEDCSDLKKKIVSAFETLVGSSMIMQEEKEYIISIEERSLSRSLSSLSSKKNSKDKSEFSKETANGGATAFGKDGREEESKYASKAYRKHDRGTPDDVDEEEHLNSKESRIRVIGNDYYPEDKIAKGPSMMSNKYYKNDKINKIMDRTFHDYYDTNKIFNIDDTMNDASEKERRFKRLRSMGDVYGNSGAVKFNTLKSRGFDEDDENAYSGNIVERKQAFKSRMLDDDDENYYGGNFAGSKRTFKSRVLYDDGDEDEDYYGRNIENDKQRKRLEAVYNGDISDYPTSNVDREYAAFLRNKEQEKEQPSIFLTSKVVLPQINDQESGSLFFLSPPINSISKNNQPLYSSGDTVNRLSDDSKTSSLQYVRANGLLVPIVNLENRARRIYLRPLNLRPLQDVTQERNLPEFQFANADANQLSGAFNIKSLDTSKRGIFTRKLYIGADKKLYVLPNSDFLQNKDVNLVSKTVASQPIVRIQTNENNAVNIQANEIDNDNDRVGSVGKILDNNVLTSGRFAINNNIASSMMKQRDDGDQIINLQSNKVALNPGKSFINIQTNEIGNTMNVQKDKK